MPESVERLSRTASRWFGLGVPFVGVLMLVTAVIGALGTMSLYESEATVRQTADVYTGLTRLLALVRDAETGQRGFVITGREEYLQPYNEAAPQIESRLNALAPAFSSDPAQAARLDRLHQMLAAKMTELAKVIALRRTAGFDAARAIVENDTGKAFMDEARRLVAQMEGGVYQRLVAEQVRARRVRDMAIGATLVAGVLTFVVCIGFGLLARRLLRVEAKAADTLSDQKALLEVTLASIGDAVITTDVHANIRFFNRVAASLTGFDAQAAIGQPVEEIVMLQRALDRTVPENPGRLAMRQRRIVDHADNLLLLRRDGTETHVEANGAPTFDSHGNLVGSVLVLRDVSERTRAEARFRLAVEAAPNAMIMVDKEGHMALVNSTTEQLFGYSRSELVGRSIDMLVPQRYRNHSEYRQAFARKPAVRSMGSGRDLYGLRRDGTEFPVEVGLNPIESPEGAFILCAVADITERKRAEQALRERTEELARSNRDLEQFAYVASHDLQEPLRAVAGPLQLLQRRYTGQLDARADEFIVHAVDGATRMQSLIDDLLSYSRVGRLEDPKQCVETELVVSQALRNLSVLIGESQAEVTHDALPPVLGIPSQLTLLFQNLIGNALKFRAKDRRPSIQIGAEPLDGHWEFSIKDNGIGIDPQYFDRIFVIFQRLHTRREYPGTGLGLALVKRIVEHHGGRIRVESTVGEGTTFFFTLARAPQEPGA